MGHTGQEVVKMPRGKPPSKNVLNMMKWYFISTSIYEG
jgi:hypothetical protein